MMSSDLYVDQDSGRGLIAAGVDVAGSVAGAGVGLVFGGSEGAIAGAVATPLATETLRWVATEVSRRVLGPRERSRAGAAVAFAAERLSVLGTEGAAIRRDGFFGEAPSGRNAAREVAEGVLLAARNSFEERKVRHIGYLFANVAVLEDIDDALAAWGLGKAEALTWRQYVLLAAVRSR